MSKKIFLTLFLSLLCYVAAKKATGNEEGKHNKLLPAIDSKPDIEVSTLSPCKISVSWTCARCVVKNYTVTWTNSNTTVEDHFDVGNATFSYEIGELDSGFLYDITVTSNLNDGTSQRSDPKSSITNKGEPVGVSGFNIDGITDSKISLSWKSSSNVCPIKGFYIKWDGYPLWNTDQTTSGEYTTGPSATSYVISNLIPDSTFTVSVQEQTPDNQNGTAVTADEVVTLETEPGAPESVSSYPLSSSSINVTWKDPYEKNGVLTGYNVSWIIQDDEGDTFGSVHTSDQEHHVIIPDLLPCGLYSIDVSAINGAGTGDPSSTESQTDPEDPPAPSNLTCSIVNSAETEYINVTWDLQETRCTFSYHVNITEEILWNGVIKISPETSDTNAYNITNLDPYALYQISVNAFTNNFIGNASNCETTSDQEVPGAPKHLQLVDGSNTNSGFIVGWSDPVDKNGLLTEFTATVSSETQTQTVPYSDYSDAYYTYKFDHLQAGVNYSVTVSATNGAGPGESSDIFIVTLS